MKPLVLAVLLVLFAASAQRPHFVEDGGFPPTKFESPTAAEIVARLTVRCDECRWDVEGGEGAVLMMTLDEGPTVYAPIVRSGTARYDVMLGPADAGPHTLVINRSALTAGRVDMASAVRLESVSIEQYTASDAHYLARSLAPIIYARPNTVGRFTDVPVFMWYEMEPAGIGTRYRYSVVFTNEDGGTPTDRLMATWGRTTDIEYIYSVVVDATGKILAEDYQGPDHVTTPFRGRREGRHPLLWVVTENNMVHDQGEGAIAYAPAVDHFPLQNVSREAVMDANPWLYEVMSRELAREGKIAPDAPPGIGKIPDPRTFLYIEACGDVGTSALAFAVRAGGEWIASDRGRPDYRIMRNGCFRAAVPLPASVGDEQVRGLRAQAFSRPPRDGKPAPPPTPIRLTRINKVFMLDEQYRPRSSRFTWEGERTLEPGGAPVEFTLP